MRANACRQTEQQGFIMKRNLLIAATIGLALIGSSGVASAQYRDEQRGRSSDYRSDSHGNLRYEINHVNRMQSQVRWELQRYSAPWHLWREYRAVSREIDRLNYEFNRGSVDRYRLHRQVERIHVQLHQIELAMRVRGGDYYRW
jgi:hypothetical protein